MGEAKTPHIASILKEPEKIGQGVAAKCNNYLEYYDWKKDKRQLEKKRDCETKHMTSSYYDMATDFFEYGWGESFHFAPIHQGESLQFSLYKHECRLAVRLGINKEHKVLDIGCGVGGPARNISTLTGASITGLNYNEYQVNRCNFLTKEAGLENVCSFIKGDFCAIPFEDNTFDRAYAIEATCHAAVLTEPYAEAYRILKPGGMLGLYEWIITDKHDKSNKKHVQIMEGLMEGNSLPHMNTRQDILSSLQRVGFEIIEEEDLALNSPVPWWSPLGPSWALTSMKTSPFGRWVTHFLLAALELIWVAPKGSLQVHNMLCKGAEGCYQAGKEGIFSPIYFVLARKPGKN